VRNARAIIDGCKIIYRQVVSVIPIEKQSERNMIISDKLANLKK